jgi:hypothetical protein
MAHIANSTRTTLAASLLGIMLAACSGAPPASDEGAKGPLPIQSLSTRNECLGGTVWNGFGCFYPDDPSAQASPTPYCAPGTTWNGSGCFADGDPNLSSNSAGFSLAPPPNYSPFANTFRCGHVSTCYAGSCDALISCSNAQIGCGAHFGLAEVRMTLSADMYGNETGGCDCEVDCLPYP